VGLAANGALSRTIAARRAVNLCAVWSLCHENTWQYIRSPRNRLSRNSRDGRGDAWGEEAKTYNSAIVQRPDFGEDVRRYKSERGSFSSIG
jgi:hypothetical protein